VVRIHSASGTTSKPLVVGYSRHDIRTWANLVARFLIAAGVNHDDVVQIAFRYGLFTGGFGIHYGAEAIGASVIPTGTGNTDQQIMIMQDYKTTALACTPGYALVLAERMEELGIEPKAMALRVGVFGGEPWSEAVRTEIETRLAITALDNYGLSEVIGPGLAGECTFKCGLHIFEDAFIPEIIDPRTTSILPPGSTGELVLTTITKEAFPMVRYRTGDITSLDYSKCICGRTLVRMNRMMVRADDMLIVKGVNIYPSQIREIIFAAAQGEAPYQIILKRQGVVDTLEISIEVTEKIFALEMKRQRAFLEMVRKRIESAIGINAVVKLVEPKSLPRTGGIITPVVDRRSL